MLIVFFGLPGAGKTYAGRLLAREFGFYFHDADHELPDAMRRALATKQPVTDEMRQAFFTRIIEATRVLQAQHPNLAIAQTFLKEKYRQQFLAVFPDARFVLVKSEPELIAQRFVQRGNYLIDLEDAKSMAARFDPPTISHHEIDNRDGDAALRVQFAALLPVLERMT